MPDNTADQKADATISDFLQQCDGEETSMAWKWLGFQRTTKLYSVVVPSFVIVVNTAKINNAKQFSEIISPISILYSITDICES